MIIINPKEISVFIIDTEIPLKQTTAPFGAVVVCGKRDLNPHSCE